MDAGRAGVYSGRGRTNAHRRRTAPCRGSVANIRGAVGADGFHQDRGTASLAVAAPSIGDGVESRRATRAEAPGGRVARSSGTNDCAGTSHTHPSQTHRQGAARLCRITRQSRGNTGRVSHLYQDHSGRSGPTGLARSGATDGAEVAGRVHGSIPTLGDGGSSSGGAFTASRGPGRPAVPISA